MTHSDLPTKALVPPASLDTGSLPQPRSFGDFELVEVILRDGPMVVWQARQARLDRLVMLKFLNGGSLPIAEQERRLRREAAAAGAVTHAGVIPVFEVGLHEGLPFLSMPAVDGEPLLARLRRAPLSARAAADLARQLAETLHDLHQRNVVHGALSPACVWVGADQRVRLAGLGATVAADDDEMTAALGYLSPEQVKGRRVTENTDVYGLGALLFGALTARPPFQSATAGETRTLIRKGGPLPPSRLNPRAAGALETVCLRCLRRNPVARYGVDRPMLRLIADLRRYLSGRPLDEGRRDLAREAGRWLRRRATALVAAALVLTTAVGWTAWQGHYQRAMWAVLTRTDATPVEYQAALLHFQKARAVWPESSELTAGLALAYVRTGQPDAARRTIRWDGDVTSAWRGDDPRWAKTQLLTLGLVHQRDRSANGARKVPDVRRDVGPEARHDLNDRLLQEFEVLDKGHR